MLEKNFRSFFRRAVDCDKKKRNAVVHSLNTGISVTERLYERDASCVPLSVQLRIEGYFVTGKKSLTFGKYFSYRNSFS